MDAFLALAASCARRGSEPNKGGEDTVAAGGTGAAVLGGSGVRCASGASAGGGEMGVGFNSSRSVGFEAWWVQGPTETDFGATVSASVGAGRFFGWRRTR